MDKKKLIKILQHPPQKKAKCPKCGGRGIVNLRGMICSDPCPRCSRRTLPSHMLHGTGEINVNDYEAWADKILKALKGGD